MLNIRKFLNALKIIPKSSTEIDSQGELEVLDSDGKLRYHNGTSASPVVTEAHTATLTNKTFNANGTGNVLSNVETADLASGVLNTDLEAGAATNAQLPSALAVQTLVDNSSGAVQEDVDDLITLSGVAANATDLGTFTGSIIPDNSDNKEAFQALETVLEGHIADTTDAHDASAISNVPSGNLAATDVQGALNELQTDVDTRVAGPAGLVTDNAIARYDGTTGKLVQNSGATISDSGQVDASSFVATNNVTANATLTGADTVVTTSFVEQIQSDSSTTGANATVAPTKPIVRLSNASLSSIDMISSPSQGKSITLINQTGVTITINNDTGGTAANRIFTGTGANLTLRDQASILLKYDNTETRWMIIGGTGAGTSSGSNYITNSDAEAGTTGWARYADAAAAIPVDGTGGSPNVTFVASSSSPLRGTQSFLLTKDAANRQGEGVSYDFTIADADKAQILRISMDYAVSANYVDTVSGNLINSDMQVFVYDVTNSQLIYCDTQNIAATTSTGHLVASFQTASNSTSYRLIFHVASTNATGYTLKFDNVVVGPQILSKGAAVTDWTSFTPTGSWTTNTTYTGRYRRVGDSMELDVSVATTGAPTATTLTVNLPSGHSIDTSKITSTTANQPQLGTATVLDSGVRWWVVGHVGYNSATSVSVFAPSGTATANETVNVTQSTPMTWANGDRVQLNFRVPIVGWSSNLQLSEDGTNRLTYTAMTRIVAQSINSATNTKVNLDTTNTDYTGIADLTNSRINIGESGVYNIVASVQFGSNATGVRSAQLWKNGSLLGPGNYGRVFYQAVNGTSTTVEIMNEVPLVKGDYIELYARQDSGGALNVDVATITISKNASPQTLAGSESVNASYETDSGSNITTSTPTTIIFEDKVADSHLGMNTTTGIYTFPTNGTYELNARVFLLNDTNWSIGEIIVSTFTKNGTSTIIAENRYALPATSASTISVNPPPLNYVGPFAKGDTIQYRVSQTSGASISLNPIARGNQFSIIRVGN